MAYIVNSGQGGKSTFDRFSLDDGMWFVICRNPISMIAVPSGSSRIPSFKIARMLLLAGSATSR